jgi:hypothetical protein
MSVTRTFAMSTDAPAKNASVLDGHLEELRHQSGTGLLSLKIRPDREYFAHAREIAELFKSLKPLRQNDRERLWREFNDIRDAVRKRLEHLGHVSKQKRELVEGRIKEALGWANAAATKEDLQKADEILKIAIEWMKDGWAQFPGATEFFESIEGNEGILLEADRDACWKLWKEAKETLRYRRKDIQEASYRKIRSAADSALYQAQNDNPHDALKEVKECGQALATSYMSKEQREEVRSVLDTAWKTAISRIEAHRGESRRKHLQWVARQEQWIEQQESWIRKTTERIEGSHEFISRLESQIDDLREQIASARTEEHADRVRGWVEEKYDKIAEVNRQIEEAEDKIRDAQNRVAEARQKLDS